MMRQERLWLVLGIAGLVPFIALSIISVFSEITIGQSTKFAFTCYSALILSFLAGTIWLKDRAGQAFGPTLCSNLIMLLAFIALLLSYPMGIALLLIGYLLMFWLEVTFGLFRSRPKGYKNMRIWLTIIVVACHFLVLSTYR